jgi:RHS repeat-associated protein
MVRESDANGNTKRQYYYDPYGNLLSFKTPSAGPYFYYHNLRGDIIMISDNIPNQEYYQYDPWGKPLDNFTDALQPFRYAGYYYDKETGLYYLKSRYYSPTLGRFLTRDGYGFVKYRNPQTLNLYAYAENNPVNNTDPSGHFVPLLAGGAAALAPGEAAAIAALGTAAIGATVELGKEVWDWFWAKDGNSDKTVEKFLKQKKGGVKNAPLEEGSPSWDDIKNITMKEINDNAKKGITGYKTFKKLLTDKRFNK